MRDEKSGARFVGNLGLYVAGIVLVAMLAYATCAAAQEDGPSAWTDAAWIAGGAVAYELGANAVNLTEWHEGRTYGWPDPFQSPSNDYGCLPWCPAETSHYVTWAGLGATMSLRGHSPVEAWLLSGVWANVVWEFLIESTYTRPSGHDIVINAGSAAVGVGLGELVDAIF